MKKLFLTILVLSLPGSWLFCSAVINAAPPSPTVIFANFAKQLTEQQIKDGSFMKNATDFYALLLENGFNTSKARIVILADRHWKQKKTLQPDPEALKTKVLLTYHSFVLFENLAYDPLLKESVQPLEKYLQNYSRAAKDVIVFSFQLADIPDFIGKANRDDQLKINNFVPVNIETFLSDPLSKSKRRER
jgi:hypothetical protein